MRVLRLATAFFAVVAFVFGAAPVAKAEEVVVYSSNQPELMDMIGQAFAKKTGHSMSVVRMGTGEAMKRLQAEKENPLADLFVGGDVAVLENAKENFQPYASPEAKDLPEGYVSKENLWAAANVHLMIIMVNTKLVSEKDMPKSWTDLLDPKWKDKVVIANPQKSGSAYAQVYGLYKLLGWDGLTKLMDNLKILDSSSLVYKSVAEGEFPVSITMEYAAHRYVAGGSDTVKIVYPSDGTIFSPEGLAMVKNCKHPEATRALIDFMLSKEMEDAIFQQYFRRPARTDAGSVQGLPAITDVKLMPGINPMEADQLKKDLMDTWKNIVLNK